MEVEAAANTVYAWAAAQILARRLPEERPSDPPNTPPPYTMSTRRCATALTTS